MPRARRKKVDKKERSETDTCDETEDTCDESGDTPVQKGRGRGRGRKKPAKPKIKACIRRLKVPLTAARQQASITLNLGPSVVVPGTFSNAVFNGSTYSCACCAVSCLSPTQVVLPNSVMLLCRECCN